MNQWSFVIGAYALTLGGTFLIGLTSWRAMRAAEKQAEEASGRA